MATVSTGFTDLLEPGLREIFYDTYQQVYTASWTDWKHAFGSIRDPVKEKLINQSRKQGQEDQQALKTMYQKAYA